MSITVSKGTLTESILFSPNDDFLLSAYAAGKEVGSFKIKVGSYLPYGKKFFEFKFIEGMTFGQFFNVFGLIDDGTFVVNLDRNIIFLNVPGVEQGAYHEMIDENRSVTPDDTIASGATYYQPNSDK